MGDSVGIGAVAGFRIRAIEHARAYRKNSPWSVARPRKAAPWNGESTYNPATAKIFKGS